MRSRALVITLSVCAAFALAPVVPWLLAATFDSIDQGWRDALSALRFTIPLALGASAVAFAVHGLQLHRSLVDRLEDTYREALEATPGMPRVREPVLVGAGAPVRPAAVAAPAAAVAQADAATAGGTVASVTEEEPAERGRGSEVGGKAKDAVRTAGKRATDRAKTRAKGKATTTARRQVRKLFGGFGR